MVNNCVILGNEIATPTEPNQLVMCRNQESPEKCPGDVEKLHYVVTDQFQAIYTGLLYIQ